MLTITRRSTVLAVLSTIAFLSLTSVQDPAHAASVSGWHYGVFSRSSDKYIFESADKNVRESNLDKFLEKLGVGADFEKDATEQVRIYDALGSFGWEMIPSSSGSIWFKRQAG
jgi:hypothetical protein